jgi:hypothetical protein
LLDVDEGDVFQDLPWREVWAHESNGFYVLVFATRRVAGNRCLA